MSQHASGLAGLRVLLVEDNYVVATELCAMLRGMGTTVQGPFGSLAAAAAGYDGCDVALLDVNIRDAPVFPLAERLIQSGIPVGLVTGYDASVLPARFRGLPLLGKPVDLASLEAALETMVRTGTEVGV